MKHFCVEFKSNVCAQEGVVDFFRKKMMIFSLRKSEPLSDILPWYVKLDGPRSFIVQMFWHINCVSSVSLNMNESNYEKNK